MENNNIISHEEVKQIFNNGYNYFYLKWKDIKNPEDIELMWNEAKEINRKHNDCELCHDILLNLSKIIHNDFKLRSVNDGQKEC
jgi:hypothetical protein